MTFTREELRLRHIERARGPRPCGVAVRWGRRTLERAEEPLGLVAVPCRSCGRVVAPETARREGWSGEWFCTDLRACDAHQAAVRQEILLALARQAGE